MRRRHLDTGEVFGLLTVVARAPYRGPRAAWDVRCACGKLRTVLQSSLVTGEIRSCGCLRRIKGIAARQTPEPPPIRGARWIALTQGRFALVDEEDFDRLTARGFWTYGASGYAYCNKGRAPYPMHFAILPKMRGMRVDHANRNRLDNRRSNLRYATHSQNCFNRKIEKGNKAGYKGVSKSGLHGNAGLWRATIRHDGKQYEIGRARDAWTASCFYDAKARELFGDFAAINDAPMPPVQEWMLSRNTCLGRAPWSER